MEADNAKSDAPQLCGVCKSFYGGPATNYLCSKCFKETGGAKPTGEAADKKPVQLPTQASAAASTQADVVIAEGAAASETKVEVKVSSLQQLTPQQTQTDKNKCWNCNKKVGLVQVPCKCGFVFCPKHRLAEAHKCEFDYVKSHQEQLRVMNPQITGEKVEKLR